MPLIGYEADLDTGSLTNSSVSDQNAEGLVNERFGMAANLADEAWDLTREFIDDLSASYYFNVPFSELEYEFPSAPTSISLPATPDRPTVDIILPDHPTAPTLTAVTLDSVESPVFDIVSPTVNFPDAPDDTLPTDPGEAPNTSEITYPEEEDYTLPDVPTIEALSIPTAPEITMPQFDGARPDIDITPPVSTFTFSEPVYSSDAGDALQTLVVNELANGTYGLENDIVDEIWDQARARQELKREAMYDEALEFFSARGWNIPPGMLSGRLLEIQKENDRADTVLNAEISIENARLSNENRKFIIKLVLDRENILLGHANSIAQRAFEAAKYTQEAAIQILNAQVARYGLLLEAYKTDAQVYESRIRAAISELEVFKARLEGVKVQADIQTQLVQLYSVQVGAVETLARIYSTRMEAAKIQADVERLRLEGYRERVNAYTARIGGLTARYNLYTAQINGEAERVKVYAEQARAYGIRVDAAKTQADINIAEANAQVEQNRILIEQYRADLDGYRARVEALVSEVQATAQIYGAEVTGFSAEVDAQKAQLDAQVASYDIMMRHETNQMEVMLKEAEINLQSAVAAHELQLKTIEAGANVSAQITASALSSVNASAQLGYNQSFSTSDAFSHSWSTVSNYIHYS